MAEGRVGSGVLQVRFDRNQIEQAGKQDLIPSAQRLAADLASTFAAVKLIDIGKAGLADLKESQQVTAQTNVLLRNQGDQAGVTKEQVDELGQSMLDLAGFDDETARSAANVLIRFQAFQGFDGLKRVEGDAADLAVTMGTDLTSAAELLGRALQSPENSARLLRPAIGNLTDEQKASIKAFTDMGDSAAAQNVILDAVESKVKGAAQQYGETLPGGIDKATSSWKEAKESLVTGFAPALEVGATAAKFLTDEIAQAPEPVQILTGGLVLLAGTTAALIRPAGDLIRLYEAWSSRAAAAAQASETVATASTVEAEAATVADEATLRRVVSNEALTFSDAEVAAAVTARRDAELQALVSNDALIASEEELTVATTASGVGMSAALGPIGLIVLGAGALVTALALTGSAERNTTVDTADYTQALKDQNGALDDNIDKTTVHQLAQDESVQSALQAGVSFKAFADAVRSGSDPLVESGTKLEGTFSTVTDELRAAGPHLTELGRELLAAHDAGLLTDDQLAHIVLTLQGLQGKLTDNKAAVDAENSGLAQTGTTADGTAQSMLDLATAEGVAAQSAKDLAAAQQADNQQRATRLTSVQNLFQAEQQETSAEHALAQAQHGVQDALRGVDDARRRVDDAIRSQTDAVERLTSAEEALKKAEQPADAETLGKAQLAVSDAHFRVADAQSAVTKAEQAAAAARKDGKHTAQEVADLDRQVEEAKNAVQSATFAETDAEKALQEVQQKGTDVDQAVIDAKKGVTDAQKAVDDAARGVADAWRGVDDAQQRVVDARQGVEDAMLNEATATANLKDKQNELYTGTSNATTATGNLLFVLDGIRDKLDPNSPLRKNIDDYIGDLGVLRDIFTLDSTVPTEEILNRHVSAGQPSQRAIGGPVRAMAPYVVGEQGPELFVPNVSGAIVPNSQLDGYAQASVGRAGITWTGNVINPAPEPASASVGHELSILADRLALVG